MSWIFVRYSRQEKEVVARPAAVIKKDGHHVSVYDAISGRLRGGRGRGRKPRPPLARRPEHARVVDGVEARRGKRWWPAGTAAKAGPARENG
jgi:hypothetical protein